MERWANNSVLEKKKSLASMGQVFFYQRWSELLNPRTLDSYQYSILNSHAALQETLDVIEGIKLGQVDYANLKVCITETLELIKKDEIIELHAKNLKNRLLHHLYITPKSKDDNVKPYLMRIEYQIRYVLKLLNGQYKIWIIEALKQAIDNNAVAEIDKYASSLASECISQGWSPRGLYSKRKLLEGESSFEEKWTNFINIVSSDVQEFKLFFKFDIERGTRYEDILSISELDMQIILGHEIINEYKHHNISSKVAKEQYYIKCPIKAYDEFAATIEALEKIGNQLNLTSFFNIISPWPSKVPTVILIDNDRVENIDLTNILQINDYVDSSLSIFNTAKRIFSSPKISEAAKRKLEGAFIYSNLSKLSWFQEVKYLNLWVAIESFVNTGVENSIIGHLKTFVPPAICIRYIFRLFRNFAEDCERCNVFVTKPNGEKIDFNQESKTEMVRELISVFRSEEYYSNLLKQCEKNCLLHYRCRCLHNETTNMESVRILLVEHNKRIEWHLQRLYRIRNQITHNAYSSTKLISPYIKNLSEYLSILIIEVVYLFDKGIYSEIEEVLEVIVDNYATITEILEKEFIHDQHLLDTGIIDVI